MLRSSELALVAASVVVGVAAALCVTAMTQIAIFMHILIYNLPFDVRLSAADRVSPWAAFGALSLGGLSLGLMESWRRRQKIAGAVDPIESNALRGGCMSLRDSTIVSFQTVISNSVGASVGLEAGYTQIGAGLGSFFGQKLGVRRNDLRLLVGAGAAAAISGSFGAPLTGAFYAFEIVLGAYSIASAGPIFAASIIGFLTTRVIAGAPYQIATPPVSPMSLPDYLPMLGLAAFATGLGVSVMWAAGLAERALDSTRVPIWGRPVIGGVIIAAFAVASPQVLGAGHGALALNIATAFPLSALIAVLSLKMAACLTSLATGFRGGLFFASLFMGALLGKIYALLLVLIFPGALPDPTVFVLVGMAAMGVVIVGGPLTMSFLVLENTADFSVTAGVLAASIAASLIARSTFGYSFSTWRLHLRGENIRSANDIGWIDDLIVGHLMQPDPPRIAADASLFDLCRLYPLGFAREIVVIDAEGCYAGLINLTEAHVHAHHGGGKAGELARCADVSLTADMNAKVAMALFDTSQSDLLAVVDPSTGAPIGILTEPYVARCYAEKADAMARSALGMS